MVNNTQSPQLAAAMSRVRTSAGWFNAIALFSVINAIVVLTGMKVRFIVGLALVDIITPPSIGFGHPDAWIALVLDAIVAGVWVLFASQAKKARRWAFITGMILYLLDAAACLIFQDFVTALFHGYVLYRLFLGVQACGEAEAAKRQAVHMAPFGQPGVPGAWPPPPSAPPLGNWPQAGQPPTGYGQPAPYNQIPTMPPPAGPRPGLQQPAPGQPGFVDPLAQPSPYFGSTQSSPNTAPPQPLHQGQWLTAEPDENG